MQSEWTKTGVPFYRAREIVKLSENGFVNNDLFISEEHYTRLKNSYNVPHAGDLMVTGVGTIGKAYIVKDTDKFYYKDASVLCFENRTGAIISDFAKMMIESDLLQEQIHSKTYGNTVDTITITTAENYICVLPPLEEQQRIISALIRAIEIIDGIENDRCNLLDTLKSLKSKILDLAIRGRLVPQDPSDEPASVLLDRIRAEKEELIKAGKIKRDKKESVIIKGDDNSYYEKIGTDVICVDDEIPFDIPKSWIWCRLLSLCTKEIKRGKAPKYVEKSNTLVFAQKCNTKSNGINMSLAQFLDDTNLKKYQPQDFLQDKDIIINSTGTGTLGRIGFFRDSDSLLPIVPDTHISVVRISNEVDACYVYSYLKSIQSTIEDMGVGSTNQKELKPEMIENIMVPIPPITEQSRIVDRISTSSKMLKELETGLV